MEEIEPNIINYNNQSENIINISNDIAVININPIPEKEVEKSNELKIQELNEQKSENLRKASCDINLLETEKTSEQKLEDANNQNSFTRQNQPNRETENISSTENNERSLSEKIKECLITENYKYIGETLNGLRDGFGISEFKNGKVYIGNWRKNYMEGYGKLTYSNGDISMGEFSNNKISGYCELIKSENLKITSFYVDNKPNEFIIYEKNGIKYEGEPQKDENNKITFGKLTTKKDDSKNIFIGNVNNYTNEFGFGMLYKDNVLSYGEIKNKIIINYIESYSNDGTCFLGFLKDSKKNGFGICFLKDGRVCIGEFEDDQRKGPVFYISTVPKPYVKMELYLLGFKTKTVEKMDTIKKYLTLNYPEYSNILKIDFQKLIDKISLGITEETSFSANFMEAVKSE